jgi:hypothetical protein
MRGTPTWTTYELERVSAVFRRAQSDRSPAARTDRIVVAFGYHTFGAQGAIDNEVGAVLPHREPLGSRRARTGGPSTVDHGTPSPTRQQPITTTRRAASRIEWLEHRAPDGVLSQKPIIVHVKLEPGDGTSTDESRRQSTTQLVQTIFGADPVNFLRELGLFGGWGRATSKILRGQ